MSSRATAAFLLLCLVTATAPAWSRPARAHRVSGAFAGWDSLVPPGWNRLPLGSKERAYTKNFPGRVARFGKGRQQLVVRHIERPSRRVHPSRHCLEASGYSLKRAPGSSDEMGVWIATRGDQRMRVEEWFVSADGQQHGDVTAWYWSAALGYSEGPWAAYTRSTPLR
jgi:hypothetical protein